MFEKVNPSHPDKLADRIAGAFVDYAYTQDLNPRIAVEVLIGHSTCHIITETSVHFEHDLVEDIVSRITDLTPNEHFIIIYDEYPQDIHLAENQAKLIRCGDNGIFKGTPITDEQYFLSDIVKWLYKRFPYDGKYIMNDGYITVCQSMVKEAELRKLLEGVKINSINPLGDWVGGINTDTGATNRKLGSDMGDSVTGGGLHGKDLSKADVSLNIYAHLKAKALKKPFEISCAIGDEFVDGLPYSEIVEIARGYINNLGGFEKFAEWGLI